MRQSNPNNQTIQLQVTRSIETFQVDYSIKATALGEVIEVTSLLFDLPNTAHHLMIGGNYKQIIAAAKAMASLFSYTIPLVAMGYLKGQEWQSSADKLITFRQQKSKSKMTYIQSTWLKRAYQIHLKSTTTNNKELILAAQMVSSNIKERYDALKNYNASEDSSNSTIIAPLLLPLLLNFKGLGNKSKDELRLNRISSSRTYSTNTTRHAKGPTKLDVLKEIYKALATYLSKDTYLSYNFNKSDFWEPETFKVENINAIWEVLQHQRKLNIPKYIIFIDWLIQGWMNADYEARIVFTKKFGISDERIIRAFERLVRQNAESLANQRKFQPVYIMAIDLLLQELTHINPHVRQAIVRCLGAVDEERVILALEKVVAQDSDSTVKETAKKSLLLIKSFSKDRKQAQKRKEQIKQIKHFLNQLPDLYEFIA